MKRFPPRAVPARCDRCGRRRRCLAVEGEIRIWVCRPCAIGTAKRLLRAVDEWSWK